MVHGDELVDRHNAGGLVFKEINHFSTELDELWVAHGALGTQQPRLWSRGKKIAAQEGVFIGRNAREGNRHHGQGAEIGGSTPFVRLIVGGEAEPGRGVKRGISLGSLCSHKRSVEFR